MYGIKAYILVSVENGASIEVQSALGKIAGITCVELLSGIYDLIVTVHASDMKMLGIIHIAVGKTRYVINNRTDVVFD